MGDFMNKILEKQVLERHFGLIPNMHKFLNDGKHSVFYMTEDKTTDPI